MTRIAVLADIHGNVPALEAVVADVVAQDVDEVLVGGDLVGRGPQGSAVIERIRALGWPSVQGNHEDFLLSFRRGDVSAEYQTSDDWAALRWMAGDLTADDARYAAGLPFTMTARTAPELRLVHGSPRSFQEGIGPWTSEADLRSHLGEVAEPVLVCAHTHRPLVRRLDGRLIVNVGSVGLPFDGDWHARYAILTRHRGWTSEHRRVAYDRGRFLDIYRSSGFRDAGGVFARLLEMEVRSARSHLVPFVEWARHTGRALDFNALDAFRADFDAERGLGDLLARQDGAAAPDRST